MDITLTLKCNNNCIFCPRDKFLSLINYKSPIESYRAIKKIRKTSNHIVLTGGEPTIIKDLYKIVKFCKKQGFICIEIITNGRLLKNEKYVSELISAGVTGFAISLYSVSNNIHDSMTRVSGSCKETKMGIINVLRMINNNNPAIRINMVLNLLNYKDIFKTINYLYRLGVRNYIIAEQIMTDNKQKHLSVSQTKKILRSIKDYRFPGAHIVLRGFAPCFFNGHLTISDDSIIVKKNNPVIFLEAPNIDTLIQEEVKKQKYIKAFLNNFRRDEQCIKCLFTERCFGFGRWYEEKPGLRHKEKNII